MGEIRKNTKENRLFTRAVVNPSRSVAPGKFLILFTGLSLLTSMSPQALARSTSPTPSLSNSPSKSLSRSEYTKETPLSALAHARVPDLALFPTEKSFQDLEFSVLSSSGQENSDRELIKKFQMNALDPRWPYLLSVMYLNLKAKSSDDNNYLLDAAARMARQSFELSRQSPYGYLALANLLSFGKQHDKALSILEKMTDAFPEETWRRNLFELKILFAAGRTQNGLSKLSVLMAHTDLSVRTLTIKLCRDFCGQNLALLKENEILNWQKSTSSPDAVLLAADYLDLKGRFDQARTLLVKGLQIFPGDIPMTHQLAIDLTSRTPLNPTLAIKILNALDHKQTNKGPEIVNSRNELVQLNQKISSEKILGLAWLLKKDLLAAETHYLKALSLSPNQEIVLAIMDDYRSEKLNRAGLSFLEKSLDISPGNYSLHALRAQIYADEDKGFVQSEDSYFDAISLNPRNSSLFNSLGLLYYKFKHLDKALTSFSIATVINPNDANAFYNMACIEALTGEKEKAIASLTKALELSPGLQTLATKDRDLTSLHVIPQFNQLTSKQLGH
jgi:tetratricopeptide (TPR) repeat protein